ncbi:uncharacterized protein AB675_8847 [Cyphellophora attinorum]|uniref:Mid2 domain-containing protein n=1 Tax=Cyphellophora attinorum TaxID=1664694 RepID=A0A0N1NY06_9EURO|nr:uncharacterized protein AB675_8847 [Phialophora attinorum]KPI36194.1 hypothetical protein AB675_8847 [Phialophora attinorum]
MPRIRLIAPTLLLTTLTSLVHGQSRPSCDPDLVNRTNPNEYFVNPNQFCIDNNYVGVKVREEGTPMKVQWVSASSPVTLRIAQINATNPLRLLADDLTEDSYEWNGCLPGQLTLENGITFNFLLNDADGTPLCSSDFFNVTASDKCNGAASSAASSITGSETSTLASTAAVPSVTSSQTTDGVASGTAGTAADDGGLGTGAKIGIGVGVGVGVLGLILFGAAFWLHRKRKGRNGNSSNSQPMMHDNNHGQAAPPYPAWSQGNVSSPTHYASELGSDSHTYNQAPHYSGAYSDNAYKPPMSQAPPRGELPG